MDFQHLQSYARLLNSFKSQNCVRQGKQLHLLFLKNGVLLSTISIANRLLQMYTRCATMDEARNLFDEMPHRNSFTWNTLLGGYAKSGHKTDMMNLFHSMPHKTECSWNVILSGLARAGELDAARRLFDEMPTTNEIAWTTMLHGYARNGRPGKALALFKDYMKWAAIESGEELSLDPFVLATVVGACSEFASLDLGKQIHARMVVDGVEFDAVLRSSVINMYAKCHDLDSAACVLNAMEDPDDYSLSSLISGYVNCGRMDEAIMIFEVKSNPCVVLWSSMISGYVANGDMEGALIFYDKMHKKGVVGNYSTFSSVLSACSGIGVYRNCTQLHAFAHKLGIIYDHVVSGALIDAYAKCTSPADSCNFFSELKTFDVVLLNSMITIYCNFGRIEEAKNIFNVMEFKSLISWNSMLVGLSRNGYPVEALEIFCAMNKVKLSMDEFSLASAISSCASIPWLELGEQIFARAIVIGVDINQVITTSLIDLYCKSGFVEIGRKLFDEMMKSDEFSWNSMLAGYAINGYGVEALLLFEEMRREGIWPSEVTFTVVLSACDHSGLVEEGKNLFDLMKNYYNIDPGIEHYSCMIDLFARAGYVQEAIDLIDKIPHLSNAYIWSAVIRSCIESGSKSLSKSVVEKIMELDPQNSGALVQLSGLMASSGDWDRSALLRQLIIQKNPGKSWCNI